jgi:murein DD-endopeptidase MepM/ murein hydrolase activator NlpD
MTHTPPIGLGLPEPGDLRFNAQTTGNARLAEAAKEFEAMLTEAMLRSMRNALQEKEEAEEGCGQGVYEDLIYQQLARTISQKPGLGVARMIGQKMAEQQQGVLPGASALGAPAASNQPGPNHLPDISFRSSALQPAFKPQANETGFESEQKLSIPVSGRISSSYGTRTDPINGQERFHRGVDFAAPAGTPIMTVDEGRVVFSGKSPQYGNVVVIEHPNQTRTLYAHLAERDVEQGDSVTRQQLIGKVGSTGRSTGPHLHFEVFEHNRNVNPLTRI